MGPLIFLLFLTGGCCLWLFFSFPPQFARKSQVKVFNWMIIGVCFMVCAAWSLNVRSQLIGTVDAEYIRPFAAAGSLGFINGFFGIGFLLRNFWIFKPKKGPWKTGMFD